MGFFSKEDRTHSSIDGHGGDGKFEVGPTRPANACDPLPDFDFLGF
jgi:hypothetical protein